MTNLRQAAQQAEPCIGKDPRCPCQDGDACHYKDCGNTKAWPVPQAEPTPWRDMVVVTLVREGIDKHRARELADHFAAQPEQGPLGWLDGNDKLAQFMHRDLKADHDKRGSATPREYTIPVYAAPPKQQAEPAAIIEVFDKDWRLEYLSLPVGKHKLYTQQYTYTTPPKRKPLTNEQADQIIGGLQTCHLQNSRREFLKVWLRDWAAHNIKEET